MNVCGAAQDELKNEFLAEMASMCSKVKEPLLIGGDFNILRFSSEKNKKFIPNRFSKTFNSLIHLYELREIDISGGQYTWSNNQSNPTLEKLDRALMSGDWENRFPTVQVHKHPRELSDHNPLVLSTRQRDRNRKRDFKFELSWLQDNVCVKRIQEIWEQPIRDVNALDRVLFRMKKVKKFLKGWGFNKAGSEKKRKKDINEEIIFLEELEEINP
jgi:hypothetical protein